MIFTWAIESVLLGLVSLILVQDYKMTAVLILSVITLGLHVVSAASAVDGHYVVSLSYFCVVTGALVAALTVPLDSMAPILSVSLLGIAELAAMGMVFASTQASTALILDRRAHYAVAIFVLLEATRCWTMNLGLILIMAYVASQLAPFDTVAHLISVGAAGGFAAVLYLENKMPGFYVVVVVGALSLVWAMGEWLVYWVPALPSMFVELPGVPKFEGLQLGALRIPPGPWLETLVFVVFFGLTLGIGVWQTTQGYPTFLYVIITPMLFSVLWIVSVWVWRASPPANDEPSAPPLASRVAMRWPRLKEV
jgi:hypothetical protein